MRRTLQFLACAAAAWFAFPATATAEPIAITSGVITLPANPGGLPARITLTGSDGTRPFEFQGVLGDTAIRPYDCHACVSQISSDIFNCDAAHGFAKYGNDRYHTGAAGDSEGHLNFNILGGPIPLPLPGATGETRSVSHSFTMSGVIFPPFSMPGAIMNTLTGSGIATLTVVGGPGYPTRLLRVEARLRVRPVLTSTGRERTHANRKSHHFEERTQ